ncbi:phytanoyl-CoA dioxygenase family protein, partial [Candidatus Poribacteria bacterium]|nr:phytanoyl-CoA dioxygenase family protein [Candidatus Poribacteria bacterium]
MLTSSEINTFVENGYIIRKNALSTTDIESYRSAIDRILHKCRVEGLHADHLRYIDGERDDIWGVNNIFHPSIRERALVDALAHPQILVVFEALIGKRLWYHLCTLLVNSE